MSCDQANSKSSERLLHYLRVENQTLLDQISILKLQCKSFEEKSRKVFEKLTCLKLLVKRAWCGDEEASSHVANIVGVAAPYYEVRNDDEIVIIPKSRALNNWALLSTKILERFYRQRDDVIFLKKREFLLERENYLDSQLDRSYVNETRSNQQSLELVLAVNKGPSDSDSFEKLKPQRSGYSFRRLNKKKSTRRIQCEQQGLESLDGLAIEPFTPKEGKITSKILQTKTTIRERPKTANAANFQKIHAEKSKTDEKVPKLNSTVKIDRHKSARTVQKHQKPKFERRPQSAHVGVKYMSIPSTKSHHSYSRTDAVNQLNVVEKELRKTTALLQKKLSINPLNFVE